MKKLIVFLSLAALLTSCSAVNNLMKSDPESNVRKIQLDMSRAQVIDAMGKKFIPMKAAKNADGVDVETFAYEIENTNERYIFELVDGRLVKWERVSNRRSGYSTNP